MYNFYSNLFFSILSHRITQIHFLSSISPRRKSSLESFSLPHQELPAEEDSCLDDALSLLTAFLISVSSFHSTLSSENTYLMIKLDTTKEIYNRIHIVHSERCLALALLEHLSEHPFTITPSLVGDVGYILGRACQRDEFTQSSTTITEQLNHTLSAFFQSGVNYCLQQKNEEYSRSLMSISTPTLTSFSSSGSSSGYTGYYQHGCNERGERIDWIGVNGNIMQLFDR